MNPDLLASIHMGVPVVTVFLTAGESDVADAAGYAASRQAGSRAAYARMAGVADQWRAEALPIGHAQVELYSLTARPELRLIFVNLPDNNDPKADGGKRALTRLWRDAGERVRIQTLVPAGGAVHESYSYHRRDVVELLLTLFKQFRPTLVRGQDAQPDMRYAANWLPYHDHPDHVMAARFTGEAVRGYRAGGANPRVVQTDYRDYNVEEAPVNLTEAEQREKLDLFAVYAQHDPQVFAGGSYDAWPRRMYHRWPLGTGWAALDSNGRVQAFLVQAGELLTWWQTADGWAGPVSLGDAGGMLAASVSVVRGADGRLRVFARRLDETQIVTLTQTVAGDPRSWPAGWESLGSPNQNESLSLQTELGAPVAAATPAGVVVFARNAAGGVSAHGPDGWTKLGGSDVQDGLAACAVDGGGVKLFAPTREHVLSWDWPRPEPAVVDSKGPRLQVACRGDDPLVLFKRPGLAAPEDVLVLATDPRAPVITKSGRDGQVDLDGTGILDTPVALRDGAGRIVLLGESAEGRLMVNQQGASGFPGWQPVGS
jgi:LmbE family N-acetylglucosaminyl deacetylase